MNWFRLLTSNANDESLRQEAAMIADSIIEYIGSSQNLYGRGLAYNSSTGILNIGEVIPGHSGLKLKFINQPGFGKNKNSLGEYDRSTLYISLPSATKANAIGFAAMNSNNREDTVNRRHISRNVAKFFNKPNNRDTLIHEINHYLDDKRTKGKVFRNYKYIKPDDNSYYNHPSEYNAFLQSFLSGVKEFSTWGDLLLKLKSQDWFIKLNEELRRSAIKRSYEFFNNKAKL